MPTYTFKCPKCGFSIDMIISMKEFGANPKPVCAQPGCDGQQEMETQLFPVVAHFKGTGWTPRFSDGSAQGPSTDLLIPKKR